MNGSVTCGERVVIVEVHSGRVHLKTGQAVSVNHFAAWAVGNCDVPVQEPQVRGLAVLGVPRGGLPEKCPTPRNVRGFCRSVEGKS